MRTRIVRCDRHTCREGDGSERVLFYKLDIGRLGRFFGPEAMPPFVGESGYVEVLGPNTRLTDNADLIAAEHVPMHLSLGVSIKSVEAPPED